MDFNSFKTVWSILNERNIKDINIICQGDFNISVNYDDVKNCCSEGYIEVIPSDGNDNIIFVDIVSIVAITQSKIISPGLEYIDLSGIN